MNIALLLAGGTGTRLGNDMPKQYIEVGSKPVILYCLEILSLQEQINAIQIVANEKWIPFIRDMVEQDPAIKAKLQGFSEPGENRQLSILSGLEDIQNYASKEDIVLIHDAARPLLSEKEITECLLACENHDGVVPVLPMKDTVYQSANGKTISALIDRKTIFAGQAPEAFRFGKYLEANKVLLPDKIRQINGSTEPAILAGLDIAMIPGDESNFKITTKEDLVRFRQTISKEGTKESGR